MSAEPQYPFRTCAWCHEEYRQLLCYDCRHNSTERRGREGTFTMRARAVSVNLSAQTLRAGTSNILTSSVMVPTNTATLSSYNSGLLVKQLARRSM